MNWNKKQTEKIQGKIREMFLEGKMTQQEIADQLHVSRAHVNRTIKKIRADIEAKKKKKAVVRSMPAVESARPVEHGNNSGSQTQRSKTSAEDFNESIKMLKKALDELKEIARPAVEWDEECKARKARIKALLEGQLEIEEYVKDSIEAIVNLTQMDIDYAIRGAEDDNPLKFFSILSDMGMIKKEEAIYLGIWIRNHPDRIQQAKAFLKYKQEVEYRKYKEKITGKAQTTPAPPPSMKFLPIDTL